MAKIWPVYEGSRPTYGGPWADMPLTEAIKWFELRPQLFVSDLDTLPGPRFGDESHDLTWKGFQHIVVEIGIEEAREGDWVPGFYKSPVKPKEAFRRLIQHAVSPAFGTNSVIRVDYEKTTDSEDQDALKIMIVLKPNYVEQLIQEGSLDALVRVKDRLQEMREYRKPIIVYATEAELAQDARD